MRRAGTILWREIEETLAREIAAGTHPIGARLPVETELASRFGVNRHTVRRALSALSERGSISIEPGRGTFVRAPRLAYPITRRTRFSETVARTGGSPRGTLVRSWQTTAAGRMAEDLELAEGTPLLAMDNLRLIEGEPVSLTTHHFPLPRFATLADAFAASGSVTQALAALGVSDYVRRLTRVHCRASTDDEARLLRAPSGSPVLVVESINAEAGGGPVEYGLSRSVGERLELVVEPDAL